jgi:hypothetical protein
MVMLVSGCAGAEYGKLLCDVDLEFKITNLGTRTFGSPFKLEDESGNLTFGCVVCVHMSFNVTSCKKGESGKAGEPAVRLVISTPKKETNFYLILGGSACTPNDDGSMPIRKVGNRIQTSKEEGTPSDWSWADSHGVGKYTWTNFTETVDKKEIFVGKKKTAVLTLNHQGLQAGISLKGSDPVLASTILPRPTCSAAILDYETLAFEVGVRKLRQALNMV